MSSGSGSAHVVLRRHHFLPTVLMVSCQNNGSHPSTQNERSSQCMLSCVFITPLQSQDSTGYVFIGKLLYKCTQQGGQGPRHWCPYDACQWHSYDVCERSVRPRRPHGLTADDTRHETGATPGKGHRHGFQTPLPPPVRRPTATRKHFCSARERVDALRSRRAIQRYSADFEVTAARLTAGCCAAQGLDGSYIVNTRTVHCARETRNTGALAHSEPPPATPWAARRPRRPSTRRRTRWPRTTPAAGPSTTCSC